MTKAGEAPLSHPVAVATIKPRGSIAIVEADPDIRDALAAFLQVASLDALVARYALARNGERVTVEGEITVEMHQICVVSLDPFPVRLTVPVRLDFLPAPEPAPDSGRRRGDAGEAIDLEIQLNEDDPPEPIVDGVLDLGAITCEFLALAIDPYPRKPGAVLAAPADAVATTSPFAALAGLKPRQ